MEGIDELKQAEAHLERAEAGLKIAEGAENAAEHEVDEAIREVRQAEALKPHEIFLEVATPKGLLEGIFHDSTKVSSVIEIVVNKKDLNKKDTFELVQGEKVLPADRTLESVGLKCKANLELVATGSGV